MASSTEAAQFIRQKNLPKVSAVDKGEFRNFFNHGVTEVHTLKQSTTVTSVRSLSYKVLGRASV